MNKLILILASAFILGGCTLSSQLFESTPNETNTVVASPTPTPLPDPELQAMPSPHTDSDPDSIEADLESTLILEEDFSDLE